jgi:ABC-type transport system involved in cytochrome c biogenesis permease subunit
MTDLPILVLTPNEILSLWSWILLMAAATALSWSNARKNSGLPLSNVWKTMTALCGWWLACAIIGLYGGPFVTLYRIGIGFAVVAVAILYLRGDFQTKE